VIDFVIIIYLLVFVICSRASLRTARKQASTITWTYPTPCP